MQTLRLDNSALSTYYRCQRLYDLTSNQRRTSASQRIATWRGSFIHKLFALHLAGESFQSVLMDGLNELTLSIEDQKERDIEHAKVLSAIAALVEAYPVDTLANGLRLIRYPQALSPYGGNQRFIIRQPEIAFQFPLPSTGGWRGGTPLFNSRPQITKLNANSINRLGPTLSTNEMPSSVSTIDENETEYVYSGAIDCIVEDGNGQWFLLELKTSGKASNSLWRDKWRLSTQPKGYVWAAQQHTAKPIAGVIIIPIMTGNKNRSTLTEEILLRYAPSEIDEWASAIADSFYEIAHSAFIPSGQYSGSCASTDFGKCDFFDYCRSGCRPDILRQTTIPNLWSPLGDMLACPTCETVYQSNSTHICAA